MSAIEEYRKEKAYFAEICAAGTLEDLADAAIAELEAENKRLKVCGNCEHHWSDRHECEEDESLSVGAGDPCHFDPSRWQQFERGDGDG